MFNLDTMPEHKALHRSSENRLLGGVCGGIAEYFNVDPTLVRIGWGVMSFLWGASILWGANFLWAGGLLLYIVAWLMIPQG